MSNKIIRTICYFSSNPNDKTLKRLDELSESLEVNNFVVQTKRICTNQKNIKKLQEDIVDDSVMLSIGSISCQELNNLWPDWIENKNVFSNLDLTKETIEKKYVEILFKMMRENPEKMFHFAYVFNNELSSPYFPSSAYKKDGFTIGLQVTDLSQDCSCLEDWLQQIKKTWSEICHIFKDEKDFLGIDSSVAPLFEGKSSLVNFVKKIHGQFNQSILTNTYLKITKFIKEQNPKPIGLCGIMFPCLEDFELAKEYENGNFGLERNLFLALHSGLGIDTYPIGIDEKIEKILDVLKLVQGLSGKYKKPLSIRFVSDGKAKIGQKTDFKNQYLKDVVVRSI